MTPLLTKATLMPLFGVCGTGGCVVLQKYIYLYVKLCRLSFEKCNVLNHRCIDRSTITDLKYITY